MLIVFISVVLAKVDCSEKQNFNISNDTYQFSLADLPYPTVFLEPQLASQVLYIHHNYIHEEYVIKLNQYLAQFPDYQDNSLTQLVDLARDDTTLQMYAGGHYNHLLYWWVMTNSQCASTQPTGQLLQMIEDEWGDVDGFLEEFGSKSMKIRGSGWTWLCMNEQRELEIRNTKQEINPLMEVDTSICYPMLGMDIWEHSWYLQYISSRTQYADQFLKVIDWDMVTLFFDEFVSQEKAIPL